MEAARETELPGLRLVGVRDVDYHLGTLGIRVGYVEQDVRPGSGHYFCGALTLDRSATAAQPVAEALTRLSYLSVRKLGLRYVILCGGAKAGDRPIGGIPVPPLDLLMLDVGASGNAAFLQAVTLHELYHMAEIRFNTLYDADWGREFTGYSNGYAPDLLKGAMGSGKPGFLNAYAETFPHESSRPMGCDRRRQQRQKRRAAHSRRLLWLAASPDLHEERPLMLWKGQHAHRRLRRRRSARRSQAVVVAQPVELAVRNVVEVGADYSARGRQTE